MSIGAGNISAEAYSVLDECKCGPEPFFVLVSSIDTADLSAVESFQKMLADLTNANFLRAFRGSEALPRLSDDDIRTYVTDRINAGEDLDEPPSAVEELSFETTDAGLALLRPDDRPIAIT